MKISLSRFCWGREKFAKGRRAQQNRDREIFIWSCYFVIKIYRRIVLKTRKWTHSPKSFTDCPTTETQVEKTLKRFCSGNIARQTRPSRPFWASFWSWHSRLSPYISYIPIHSSKKSKNKSRTNKQIHTKAPKTQKNWVANYLFHDSWRLHHTSTFQIPGTMDDPMMTPWPHDPKGASATRLRPTGTVAGAGSHHVLSGLIAWHWKKNPWFMDVDRGW
jgi:hypothetical protein